MYNGGTLTLSLSFAGRFDANICPSGLAKGLGFSYGLQITLDYTLILLHHIG
jgi:hypothetical protein